MSANTSESKLFEQDDFFERYDWCLKHLGRAQDYPPRWAPGDLGRPLRFRFRDPQDEVWFRLHWGG
jgi:hypothetical protein